MARHLVTSALPYINGTKHLGNLIGSMLPADVFSRFMRQSGHEVLFICATDEHGTPAELAAHEAGQSVEQFCAEQHEVQKSLGERWQLSFDHFGRSSSQQNKELTQHLALQLNNNGLIEERTTIQAFSVEDNRFLPDRYITGTCPHCNYERARGDQCENCTRVLDPTDLINPKSAVSGSSQIEFRESKHLFLLQSGMSDELRAWIDSKTNWPQLVSSIALKWLNEGLQDRGITRDLTWGVPVPEQWPDLAGKVFYVWFDAPIEYIGATKEWADFHGHGDDWKNWWYDVDDEVTYTQFMAKDNIPFHTVSFPATILGSKEPWKLVDQLKGFNWLTYYGGKFSTSQQRGIFMDRALEIAHPDVWRYTLLANAPETSDADFTWEMLALAVNKDLAGAYGNFVNRVFKLVNTNFDSKTPSGGDVGAAEEKLAADVNESLLRLNGYFSEVQIRKAMQEIRNLWSLGNAYIDQAAPWKTVKVDRDVAAMQLRTCLRLVEVFAQVSYPVMPATSRKVLEALGADVEPSIPRWSLDESADYRLSALEVLFTKIDDSQVAEWEATFGS